MAAQVGVRSKRRKWAKRLARRRGWRCHWCKCLTTKRRHRPTSATVDHLVPLSRGGTNSPSNVVVACLTCNLARGAQITVKALDSAPLFRSRSVDAV